MHALHLPYLLRRVYDHIHGPAAQTKNLCYFCRSLRRGLLRIHFDKQIQITLRPGVSPGMATK